MTFLRRSFEEKFAKFESQLVGILGALGGREKVTDLDLPVGIDPRGGSGKAGTSSPEPQDRFAACVASGMSKIRHPAESDASG